MPENTLSFDFTDFYDEGFEKTTMIEQAIYIFRDGSLWSGYSEGGDGYVRDVDHGSIEAFLIDHSMDRYHQDFWSVTLKEMVQVIPETKIVLLLKENEYTDKHLEVVHQLEEAGFSIEILESTLGPKQVEEKQNAHIGNILETESAEKEETQTVSPEWPGSEEFIVDLHDKPFMYEVTTLFTDFTQEIDETLGEVPKSTEPFITRAEIERLLTEHMDRMEAIMAQHTAALIEVKEPTNEQVQLATQKLKRDIQTVLRECKEKLTSYLTTKKERAVLAVSDTLDDIRIGVKNELTYRILNMNTALKNFSKKIDQMVSFEVKATPEMNVSEGVTESEAMNATKPLTQLKNTAMEQVGTDQPIEQPTKEVNEEVNEQVESETGDHTPSGKEQSVDDEYQQHQFTKIKGLSQQLGYEVSEKNRQDIAALSPAEIKTLIQSLETKVVAQSKSIPDQEVGLEL
ncbi:hypothetical protein [Enterococcus sp. DIV1420a]|uniref:hypothetical protein n=1 Tax=Enterococcus sp. DIV1420a TaxID=2774672 RepID=UPI003F24B52D